MPVFHCGPWSQLTVGCFLVVPEVSLLDRLVPSTGEKEQSEALSFLNFWEEKSVFLYPIFSIIFRNILHQKRWKPLIIFVYQIL